MIIAAFPISCSLYRAVTRLGLVVTRLGLIFLIATASVVFKPAVCTARETVEPDRPEPGSGEDSVFNVQEPTPVYDPKQVGLIRARILSRRGMVEESLSIYRDLRRRYPQDEEIWEDYIETLVNEGLYEKALEEADGLLKKNPSNLRALRIQARIYAELGRFAWTYPLFEKILRDRPRDAGAWSDYAFARQDAGDWAAALNYFQRVLELDPENGEALRQVQTILREHRPRLDMAYQAYRQEADDAARDQYTVRYRRHITPKWTLDVRYDRIHVERPEQVGAPALEETTNDVTAKVDYRFHDDWLVRVGGGLFNGPVDGPSGLLGVAYKIGSRARIQGDYFLNRPWYDPVESAAFEGRFDQGRIALDWNIDEKWGLFAGVEQWDYDIRNIPDYGKRRTFTGILTRRFSEKPAFSISYAYYRSRFRFEEEIDEPILLIEEEGVHGLSFDFEHWPCRYWGYELSGGVRRDHVRALDAYFVLPGLVLRMGNRLEGRVRYEFSSESSTVGGGKTHTLDLLLRVIL